MEKIFVRETGISIQKNHNRDYISLTDIARYKNPTETALVISHWLSTRFTVDFLGIWETINNPDFNTTEFSSIRNESGNFRLKSCYMNYNFLKMKSILFNSKCGDADSSEQYGGDDPDQQKEQDHFPCIELSDMPDQPDQSQSPELHNDEKAGTADRPEKFFVGEIPPGRNLTIYQ